MKKILIALLIFISLTIEASFTPTINLTVKEFARNDYSSTNVTTSAYVELIASTSSQTLEVEVFDSSGRTLVLAIGGAGSEVDQFYIVAGGNGRVPLRVSAGTRISIKAVSANATAGEIVINLLGQ